MDLRTRMEIEWQCGNLCYEFAHCINRRRYAQLAALFTADGVFDHAGQRLAGRQAIVEAMSKRQPELRTRHLCHNVHFTEVSEERARALVYNTTLAGKGDPDGQSVLYAMSQGAFLELHDEYRKICWRIDDRLPMCASSSDTSVG